MLFTAQMLGAILVAPGPTAVVLVRLLQMPTRHRCRVSLRKVALSNQTRNALYPAISPTFKQPGLAL